VIHYQLTDQERKAISLAARSGAHFDRPEMACRTGDGHALGVSDWNKVTCPRCRITKAESYAVIIRAIHERGESQLIALAELDRRGLWLAHEQRTQAGLDGPDNILEKKQ